MPEPIVPDHDGSVDRKRAAALCGVSEQCIANWEKRGYRALNGSWAHLPVKRRVGRSPRYEPLELAKVKRATDDRARRVTGFRLAAVA